MQCKADNKPILMHKIKTHMLDIDSNGDLGVKTIKMENRICKNQHYISDNDNLWVKIDGKKIKLNNRIRDKKCKYRRQNRVMNSS